MRLKVLDPYFDEHHEWILFLIMLIKDLLILYFGSFFLSSSYLIIIISLIDLPIIYNILKYEEMKDIKTKILKSWKLHYKAIGVYFVLFMALTSASFLLVFSPRQVHIFKAQSEVVNRVNSIYTGNFYAFSTTDYLLMLLSNNVRVLIFSIMLSLLFGFGSLVILNWNATVLGYVMGLVLYDNMKLLTTSKGIYFLLLKDSLKYLIHGIPEILAYLLGAFAGGMIFSGIIHHHFSSKVFRKVLYDASYLIFIAFIFLILAALLETFVTPII